MSSKQNRNKVLLLGLVAVLLLSLPLVVGAQTSNGITSPADGATVGTTVEVTGYADDPNFSKWQLDLLPEGNAASAIFLAVGTQAGAFTYTLDTSNFPNGQHALRLRVVRSDSNYNEYTTNFTVARGGAAAPAPAATATPAATAAATTTAAPEATATPAPAATATTATPGGNGITAPAEGATVSGTVNVTGNATHASFMKWQLDLLPGGDETKAIFLALGEEQGAVSYSLDTSNYPAGEHALRLRVVRADSNYDEYVTKFTIGAAGATATPAATTAMTTTATTAPAATTTPAPAATEAAATPAADGNGITAPAAAASVSGTVNVTGNANDPNFLKWQLDLLPGGDDTQAIFLAVDTDPGAFSYSLDTTNYPAGEHALRLRVVRSDSNYNEYTSTFTIANP